MKFKVFQDLSTKIGDQYLFYFTETECSLDDWYDLIDDDSMMVRPDDLTSFIGEYTTP